MESYISKIGGYFWKMTKTAMNEVTSLSGMWVLFTINHQNGLSMAHCMTSILSAIKIFIPPPFFAIFTNASQYNTRQDNARRGKAGLGKARQD